MELRTLKYLTFNYHIKSSNLYDSCKKPEYYQCGRIEIKTCPKMVKLRHIPVDSKWIV